MNQIKLETGAKDSGVKDTGSKDAGSNMISINSLSKKMVPVRIEYKNHWIVVKNLEIKTFNEAKEVSYGWMKTKTMKKLNIPVDKSLNIVTLSFSKKFEVVEIDVIQNGITDERDEETRGSVSVSTRSSTGGFNFSRSYPTIYVLRYPNNDFASVLNNI